MSKGEKKDTEVEVPVATNGNSPRFRFANLYSTYGSEPELERKGVVMDYELANGETFSIKIKRGGARNQEWKKVYNEVMKPHQEEIAAGKVSEEDNKKLLGEVWSRTVVVGWSNLRDHEGNEIPFSVENCFELFCAFPDLLNEVIADSHLRSNFQEAEMVSTAKNS